MKPLLVAQLTLGVLSIHGQAANSGATVVRQMRQIYVQDQRDRGVMLSDSGEPIKASSTTPTPEPPNPEVLEKRDAERRSRTLALLRAGEVTTTEDFHDAAFIFQHGETADDYLLSHIFAVEAIVKGDASSKWISAAALDRYLQAIGRPQVFGTQYLDRDYLFMKEHENDPQAMKNHKPDPGMTQEPYNTELVPDALRLDFCVPGLAQQRVNLREFEAGKYPKSILPPGCTR